jgi:hypothetical protein
MSVKKLLSAGVFLALLALTAAPLPADVVDLKPDHPERYVVQKGDTLWDISKRFLKDPWRWASVWTINEQIKNPHLIYPGDVIVLTWVDGKPQISVQREEKLPPAEVPVEPAPAPAEVVAEPAPAPIEVPAGETPSGMKIVKLKPRAYVSRIEEAIPTITPDAITPFLTQPLVVSKNQLEKAGYVTIGLDDRRALGNGSEFYARGLSKRDPADYYQIFRQGNELRHPDSGELLAYEAVYLGDARMLEPGDPTKLAVTTVKQEILPTDRLMKAPEKGALPYYFPRAPEKQVKGGYILAAVNGLREFGPSAVVAISLGKREGMEEGHVLRIMRHVGKSQDPVTKRLYKMPDEDSGLLMVFRVFDKVSYALIMDADRPIRIGDSLRTP